VRDVTFGEDASQVRPGSGPQLIACVRNLASVCSAEAGPVNLTAALRYRGRDPTDH
jgi:hypothetical protein